MKKLIICGLLAFSVSNIGCATAIKGTSGEVEFAGIPYGEDGTLYDNGVLRGKLGDTVDVKRTGTHVMEVKSEKYGSTRFTLEHHTDVPWVIADSSLCALTFWTLIGCVPLGVDVFTGSFRSYESKVYVDLENKEQYKSKDTDNE